MIEQFTNLTNDGTALVLLGIRLAVIIGIAFAYWSTKAMVPTVAAVIVGGIVWWSVNNVDTVSEKVETDLGGPVQIYEHPAAEAGSHWFDFAVAA